MYIPITSLGCYDLHICRMRRYFKPSLGPCKASKEALQLYGSEDGRRLDDLAPKPLSHISILGTRISIPSPTLSPVLPGVSAIQGNKLRQLLEKHGSFKELEYHVKKYVRELEKEGKKGRWVTKQYLTDIMKYSKLLGQHGHWRCCLL